MIVILLMIELTGYIQKLAPSFFMELNFHQRIFHYQGGFQLLDLIITENPQSVNVTFSPNLPI